METHKSSYKIIPNHVFSFKHEEEPLIIHIIKTGFENKYLVVWEDAFEQWLGDTKILTKKQIEENFGIFIGDESQPRMAHK